MGWRGGLGRLPAPLRRRALRPVVRRFSRAFTATERRRVAAGKGAVGGWVAGGVPTLLLTTTGRRSGLSRTVPLLCGRRPDGTLLLVAANGAADWDPDWLANLRADPAATVELDGERLPVSATVLDDGPARDEAWPGALAAFPELAATQRACRRPMPLVVLVPRGRP